MNAVPPPSAAQVYGKIEALGKQHNVEWEKKSRLRGVPLRQFCELFSVIEQQIDAAQAAGNQQLAQDWDACKQLWDDLCKAIGGDLGRDCCEHHRGQVADPL
jgi:hypothetical protein